MRKLAGALLAGTLIGVAVPAVAAETNGWYVGAQVGLNRLEDADASGAAFAPVTAEFDNGYGLLGQVGYGFGAFRLEGELGWRTNGVDSVGGAGGSGDLDAATLMANVYYDIQTGSPLTPYLGVGLGAARLSADKITAGGVPLVDDSDTVFAYQGILGASYELDRNLLLKADYRYLRTEDPDFTAAGTNVKSEYASHSIMVGFTWRFAAPEPAPAPVQPVQAAPPPAPPPAPAPKVEAPPPKGPDSYMVFFDWDKADVSSQARETLKKVAANAKAGKATRVELTGHADRSGAEPYNLRLSQRRADNVKKVLSEMGLPADSVTVAAKGETSPLVATPDGVREPQNRRVEIVVP